MLEDVLREATREIRRRGLGAEEGREMVDEKVGEYIKTTGINKTELKKESRKAGYCLRNFKCYGSSWRLRQELQMRKGLRINKETVKQYKNLSLFLVPLD
eukprot:TRINITY_DN287_c0_g1_i1.p2 TRINITY_DN287_c0_g1~~TRINITY_DN287_c0_g1_i1.p2  ORF type:complete len:100 (-),score=10.65 TRINITY_DN287_c0_g1_i1:185-484(-)